MSFGLKDIRVSVVMEDQSTLAEYTASVNLTLSKRPVDALEPEDKPWIAGSPGPASSRVPVCVSIPRAPRPSW